MILHISSPRLAKQLGGMSVPAEIFNSPNFVSFAQSDRFIVIVSPRCEPFLWEVDPEARKAR